MYLKQFYLACLSQASYMVGSDGEAAVIDPRRDVEEYLEEARRQGFTIRHVLETHFHADFVSGHRELAARTGAPIYFGARARPAYPVVGLADGDEVRVGRLVLRALETPGHTPESVCYVVEEEGRPRAVLTGDTLFVGEVGRPDLMGVANLTAETMAGMLHDSLHCKLLTLPDDVIVYPAHGPGSACGRNIGPDTSSTIGKERRLNYALHIARRDEFIAAVTADLPAPPRYFPHDARLNREGAATVDDALARLRPCPAAEVRRLAEGAALVLDARPAAAYGEGHVPGSVNIGLDGRYASWAGTVIDPTTPLVLVADAGREREAALRLARVGYENAVGYLHGGMDGWRAAGLPVRGLRQLGVQELQRQVAAGEVAVLDVRGAGEWDDGHIAGAAHRCLTDLAAGPPAPGERAVEARPLAVICGSGYRSSIACSLLERWGTDRPLLNVIGGMGAWRAAGLPVER